MLINNTVVLDASVVIKWYHEEEDSETAEAIERKIKDGELRAIAPPLLFYEVANALLFKPNASPEGVIAALRQLQSLNGLSVLSASDLLLENAVIIAKESHLSVYDAIYVSLAFERNIALISADQKMVHAMNSSFVRLLSKYFDSCNYD